MYCVLESFSIFYSQGYLFEIENSIDEICDPNFSV